MEVVPESALIEFFQMDQERMRIAGPEDEHVYILGIEGNVGWLGLLSIEGVGYCAVASTDAIHEPLTVESWYVCAAASTNDQGKQLLHNDVLFPEAQVLRRGNSTPTF